MDEIASDIEVTDAFATYFTERAEAGVMLAKHVERVTLEGRAVVVHLNEAHNNVPLEVLLHLSPFDNLATFPGTVIAFNDELGARLRPRIDEVRVQRQNGEVIGSMSTAEIYKRGTGHDLA
ncbi:hypothetical protein [Pseudoclavibacter sp. VKM Ac-2888]|uniref:hypothetical protein n=1 Tax=Pseudoclavibacter sp. VKM Ac-2888 TaxID=2783830 RepID=UPI00188CCA48|nr:hypothetical protein [Pseudoclavibacter sp. VKM Ac-2888]MBF4549684.1 hypothetical protein [Pseudoclavibacter sp. VKM Ac-2888]